MFLRLMDMAGGTPGWKFDGNWWKCGNIMVVRRGLGKAIWGVREVPFDGFEMISVENNDGFAIIFIAENRHHVSTK